MDPQKGILDGIDPEVSDRIASRRDLLRGGGRRLGAALALGSVPVAFGVAARQAFAQEGGGLPEEVQGALNFALTLEYLESEFYKQGLAQEGLIPQDAQEIFQTIGEHENAHVEALEGVLGDAATEKPSFDFTAGGKFDTFDNYDTFLLLSQAFEDTGVRAYKGQAGKLVGQPELLTTALNIHSVEARHAARVRRLRELQGWIPFDQPDAPRPIQPVYATDPELAQDDASADVKNVEKYGVNVVEVSPIDPKQVTEAFDEPLGQDAVLKIAGQFIEG